METVKDASSSVRHDTDAACLLVSVLERSLSASESVQQQLMQTHSCEPVTPGFHIPSAALRMSRGNGREKQHGSDRVPTSPLIPWKCMDFRKEINSLKVDINRYGSLKVLEFMQK